MNTDNNRFSAAKDELLTSFDKLRDEYLARNSKLLNDDERKIVSGYTIDDARTALGNMVSEGNNYRIPKNAAEAIIHQYNRPAYFVQNDSFDTKDAPSTCQEVDDAVNNAKAVIDKAIPSVGRINLRNHRLPWVGTGWVVHENILVTNRHVAREFASQTGDSFVFVGGAKANLDTIREYDTVNQCNSNKEKVYRLRNILWIEPDMGHDVAFLSIDKVSDDDDQPQPALIDLMDSLTFKELSVGRWISVIGYPALSPYNSLEDQQRIFEGVYGVKRLMPGQIMELPRGGTIVNHDATTLGGASGSAVIDLASGKAVSLHFGGIEGKTNDSVAAPVVADMLNKYLNRSAKPRPISGNAVPELALPPAGSTAVSQGGTATWKIPLEISVTVGTPELLPQPSSRVAIVPHTSGVTREGLFSSPPKISLDELKGLFSLPSLADKAFNWRTALSLAAASELAYEDKPVVQRMALNWGFESCKFIDVDSTQCFIASSSGSALIAFRGTQEWDDVLVDLNIFSVERPYGSVHKGFYNAFRDVREALEQELQRLSPSMVMLAGHSLGGALATIAAAEWSGVYPISSVYTFGQPAVGKGNFPAFFNAKYKEKFFRFVNNNDIVTSVPPTYQHIIKLLHLSAQGALESLRTAMADETDEAGLKMMSESEFDALRAQLLDQRARRQSAAVTESLAREPVLEEGLSVDDHRLSEYIRKIKSRVA